MRAVLCERAASAVSTIPTTAALAAGRLGATSASATSSSSTDRAHTEHRIETIVHTTVVRSALVLVVVLCAWVTGCSEPAAPGATCGHASDCGSGTVCIAGRCTAERACTSSRTCPHLVCSTSLGVCVECNTTADCDAGLECESGVCVMPPPPCSSDRDCSGIGLVCDTSAGVCVECIGDVDCPVDERCGADHRCVARDMDAGTDTDANDDAAADDTGIVDIDMAVVAMDGGLDAGNDAGLDTSVPDAFVPMDTSGCAAGLRLCSGRCVDTTSDSMNCSSCGVACPSGYSCVSGGCTCATRCGGVCTDLTTSAANCGTCGHACAPGDFCRGGLCYRPACPEGLSSCGGCVDTETDIANCGSCGAWCTGSQFCRGGSCSSTCSPPLDRSAFSSSGPCRDGDSDPGTCGVSGLCQADEVCELETSGTTRGSPTCMTACGTGLTQCGRACVNTRLSVLDCGSCGHACGPDEVCANGVCGPCPAGQTRCGLACVDLGTDVGNCGGCGIACPRYCRGGTCTTVCSAPLEAPAFSSTGPCHDADSDPMQCGSSGACQADQVCELVADGTGRATPTCMQACGPGLTQCGRSCVNTQLSVLNCGSCGHACAVDELCANGVCGLCPAGQTRCGSACVDTTTDIANCGGCGITCPRYCRGGACTTVCAPPLESPTFSSSGPCHDADSDPTTCGATGTCQADQVCELESDPSGRATPTCMQACGPGLTQCGRACVNTQLNVLNCGTCGHACALDEFCANGVCGPCPAGQTRCGPLCVDTESDVVNCGGCGISCGGSSATCRGGTCASSCDPPLERVGGSGPCRDADSDPANCGASGSCQADQVCELRPDGAGRATRTCVQACSPGLTQCGRSCVNTRLNVLNCGTCGHACPSGEQCADGVCAPCTAGQTLCGASCTDTATDLGNCGGCGITCSGSGVFCRGGTCTRSCDPPLDRAGASSGPCRDANSDPSICGAFGSCQTDQVCELEPDGSGRATPTCMQACSSDLTQCGRACVNTRINVLHCGTCGHACAPEQFCVAGTCVGPTLE